MAIAPRMRFWEDVVGPYAEQLIADLVWFVIVSLGKQLIDQWGKTMGTERTDVEMAGQ